MPAISPGFTRPIAQPPQSSSASNERSARFTIRMRSLAELATRAHRTDNDRAQIAMTVATGRCRRWWSNATSVRPSAAAGRQCAAVLLQCLRYQRETTADRTEQTRQSEAVARPAQSSRARVSLAPRLRARIVLRTVVFTALRPVIQPRPHLPRARVKHVVHRILRAEKRDHRVDPQRPPTARRATA